MESKLRPGQLYYITDTKHVMLLTEVTSEVIKYIFMNFDENTEPYQGPACFVGHSKYNTCDHKMIPKTDLRFWRCKVHQLLKSNHFNVESIEKLWEQLDGEINIPEFHVGDVYRHKESLDLIYLVVDVEKADNPTLTVNPTTAGSCDYTKEFLSKLIPVDKETALGFLEESKQRLIGHINIKKRYLNIINNKLYDLYNYS